MKIRIKPILRGLSTYVPGIDKLIPRKTGGTDSARYCYSVWLRHLVMARKNGLNYHPKVVAELGPGDSLGIGLAALISGCDKYYAFDVFEFADIDRNMAVFDELVQLFKSRTAIPDEKEFPRVKPYLENYSFPGEIFDADRMEDALSDSRLEKIRASIMNMHSADSMLMYKVPWYDSSIREESSVDMIYSQAVLEHVDELADAYKCMRLWLADDGYISHQIDFKSHETAHEWNGHWVYSDFLWGLIRGRRPYLLNRQSHSVHISILEQSGFDVVCDDVIRSQSKISLDDLASAFKHFSEDDLTVSGAFIQASKKMQ